MNSVNKTLYIPLYGKSFVSQKGLFLKDKKAEEIWKAEAFPLKRKAKSKWLAYYMGIRSAVFDEWLKHQMNELQDSVVIHLGCGMDSRIIRVNARNHKWYDIDFFDVIKERKKYYLESSNYQMIAGDARDIKWLSSINENKQAIVIMEGISMYLTINEMKTIINNLCSHFENVSLLVDCYTSFSAKMSKYKNPINNIEKIKVYGINSPKDYHCENFNFVKEHALTPKKYINELKGYERFIFSNLYAGCFSKKLYRLFEYKK